MKMSNFCHMNVYLFSIKGLKMIKVNSVYLLHEVFNLICNFFSKIINYVN